MGPSRALPAFPRLRWWALGWLLLWTPVYAWHWGWTNFLALCDLAVIVSCVGIWTGSRLLLSSQALLCVVVGVLWVSDVASRLVFGQHLVGGAEYMWDDARPLWVRLLSSFHAVLPVVLWRAVREVGYDRRALPLQVVITGAALVAARLAGAPDNLNYALRDPIFDRELGAAWAHLVLVLIETSVLVYLPAHFVLERFFGSEEAAGAPLGAGAARLGAPAE